MTDVPATPANQGLRINLLRVTVVLLLPLLVFSESAWLHPEWLFDIFEVTGVFLVIAGVLGRFWAILYIGGRKNAEVLQEGPYSICRHPLYLFSVVGVVGFGMMLGSVFLTAVMAMLVFVILSVTARREEAYLVARFAEQYRSYARRTPRILPNPALFRSRDEVTFNVETLRRNFFDALVFLSLIPLAELLEAAKELHWFPTFVIY